MLRYRWFLYRLVDQMLSVSGRPAAGIETISKLDFSLSGGVGERFEHCRAEGRTDCDAILNAPVTSTPDSDSVQAQERRKAYDRCVERDGRNCDDLLRH